MPTRTSRLSRAIAGLLLAALPMQPVAAQPWGPAFYIDRWDRQTRGCGTTRACCVRQVQCMMETWSRINADAKAGNLDSPFAATALETDPVWRPVRTHIANALMARHCPANIRRAAHDILTRLSTEFDLVDLMRESGEDSVNFMDELSVAIDSYPPGVPNFLLCETPADQLTLPDDPDPTEDLLRRAESAVRQADPVAAALYASMLAGADLAPRQSSRRALLGAEIAGLKGADPLPGYRDAAQSAAASGADEVLIAAAEPLRDAAFAADDAEAALAWQVDLARARARRGALHEAVSDYAIAARLAQHLQRQEDADRHFETAHALAAELPGGTVLAQSMLQHLSLMVASGRPEQACTLRDRITDLFKRETLSGDAALEEASGDLDCDRVRAYRALQDLLDAAEAAQAAGDGAAAIAAMDRAVAELEKPLFQQPDAAGARAMVYGNRGWFHLLSGTVDQARRDTETARQSAPDEAWLRANLGFIDLLEGNAERALATLVPLMPMPYGDGRSWAEVFTEDIRLLKKAGHPDAAFAPLQELLTAPEQ